MNRLMNIRNKSIVVLAIVLTSTAAVVAQNPPTGKPEMVSPMGAKFYALPDEKGAVAAAAEKSKADPNNIDSIIALGAAQAGIRRFHEAIETYTRGLKLAPTNATLYRHRGHRYISVRQFKKASGDLEKGAKLNAKDYDIWYHLGLSYYLRGDFARAARAYESCLGVVEEQMKADPAKTEDSLVAVADWLYMTCRRSRQEEKARRLLERIVPGMNVKQNRDYYDRLLMYKGLRKEEELLNMENATPLQVATLGYGVGNWHLYNGRRERAMEIFRKIVAGEYWPAFGFIAAEAELLRNRR